MILRKYMSVNYMIYVMYIPMFVKYVSMYVCILHKYESNVGK